jgi:hypothetical protein
VQTVEAVGDEALTPLADGMAVTAKFVGDVLVGGVVGLSDPQDDAAAEDQGLWGGARPDECLELGAELG